MDANFTLEDPETFKYVIPMTLLDAVDAKHRTRNALITVPKNSLKLMQEKVMQRLFTFFLNIVEKIYCKLWWARPKLRSLPTQRTSKHTSKS
jgi:hypothetical protein